VHRVLLGNLRERDHWGDPDREYNIKMDLKEVDVGCGGLDGVGSG
jgi:hypothetical protein